MQKYEGQPIKKLYNFSRHIFNFYGFWTGIRMQKYFLIFHYLALSTSTDVYISILNKGSVNKLSREGKVFALLMVRF